jgi:hypothetical protein
MGTRFNIRKFSLSVLVVRLWDTLLTAVQPK